MGVEIERKFLVTSNTWRQEGKEVHYRQGYLCNGGRTVRVRIRGDEGILTIKGHTAEFDGISRLEYEYPIPLGDAEQMLERLCIGPIIDKHRYTIEDSGNIWEIDEFHGDNNGLIVAEIELEDENQDFDLPAWVGREVSNDGRYFNASLVHYPFCQWGEDEVAKE